MVVNIKYNINALCKKVLQEQLEKLQVPYQQLVSPRLIYKTMFRPKNAATGNGFK